MSVTEKVEICADKINGISRWVEAYIENGCLRIEGQDLGSSIISSSEYEYFFDFSKNETKKFTKALTGNPLKPEAFLDAFAERFSGSKWHSKFIKFCKENELHYEFFSC